MNSSLYFTLTELDWFNILLPWFCNQGNKHSAPSERSQLHSGEFYITLSWFYNKCNKYYAPMWPNQLQSSEIPVMPCVSSADDTTPHSSKPNSGESFVTSYISSMCQIIQLRSSGILSIQKDKN